MFKQAFSAGCGSALSLALNPQQADNHTETRKIVLSVYHRFMSIEKTSD